MRIRDHIIKWANQNEPVSINEIAEHVQILFNKQASAARQGMDASKAVAYGDLEQARRLHAETNPDALESERAANAQLTEELEEIRGDRDALAAHVERFSMWWGDESKARLDLQEFAEIIAEQPTASLARRDAEKQAEVLEQVYARWSHRATVGEILSEIDHMARNRRRQAEGSAS